jgi:hypothetical protein
MLEQFPTEASWNSLEKFQMVFSHGVKMRREDSEESMLNQQVFDSTKGQ